MTTGSARKQAVIYARVSTEEQSREGFSIPAQIKLLREYAKRNNLHIVKEFQDNETAKSTGRPGFGAMLSFIRENPECQNILVEKTDRLTRNVEDYLALDLERTDIVVHLVKENRTLSKDSPPEEFLMQDFQVSIAKYYSRNISREAKKGMKAKAEAGWYPSQAPMGYKNIQNPSGVKIIVPDEEKVPIVELIFETYADGNTSIKDLRDLLWESGFTTRKGKKISTSSIHKMLRNPIYRGQFLWNGVLYEGKHEPIISAELWYKVQDMSDDRSVEKPKQKYKFPYTGLITCADCGCAITAELRKMVYRYYHCTEYKGKHGAPYIREEKLTEQFTGIVQGVKVDKDVAEWILGCLERSTADKRKTLRETRERLEKGRERLLRRLETLYDDRLDRRISVEMYDRRSADSKQELEILEEKLASLSIDTMNDPLESARGTLELLQDIDKHFLIAEADEKRRILEYVLSNCTLRDSQLVPVYAQHLAIIANANSKWRGGGSVSGVSKGMRSCWHPEPNSNSSEI